jgi:hypothetical protein
MSSPVARSLGINLAANVIADPHWERPRFRGVLMPRS